MFLRIFVKNFLDIYCMKEILDLFNNPANNIIGKWAGERRHEMPRFFLSGCTG
jgi:hypothetical protein